MATRIEDRARLGPEAAALKEKLRPARWKKLVKAAHKRGFTVDSYISENLPDALKARTKDSLRKQALSTVKDAYAPAVKELGDEERRITALDAKRGIDERHFQEWLTTKTDKLMAEARAADDALATRQGEVAKQVSDSWAATRAAAPQNAAATPGNVSDPAQSTALASLGDAEKKSQGMVANQRQASAQMISSGEKQMSQAQAANMAQLAAQNARRQGETWAALGKVSDARGKLKLDQAADASKEVARLLEGEVVKAEKNREFGAVAAELDLKNFTAQTEAKQKDRDYNLKKGKFNLDKWIAANKVKADRLKRELEYDKIEHQDGRAAADRALKERIEKDKRAEKRRQDELDRNEGPKPTGADRNASRTAYQTVETIKGDLISLHRKYPQGKSAQGKSFRAIMKSRGYSDPQIDVAEDLRRNNGKLSAAGRRKARAIGILRPEKYWK